MQNYLPLSVTILGSLGWYFSLTANGGSYYNNVSSLKELFRLSHNKKLKVSAPGGREGVVKRLRSYFCRPA